MANINDGAKKLIKEIFENNDKITLTGNNPLKDVIGTIIHNDGTKETKSFKSIPDFIYALLNELKDVQEEETTEAHDEHEDAEENTENDNTMNNTKQQNYSKHVSVNEMLKNEYEAHQADLIHSKLDKIVSDIVMTLSDTSIKHEFCAGTDTVQAAVKLVINPEFDFTAKNDCITYVCEEVKELCDFDYVSVSKRSTNGEITLYCVLK